MSSSSIVSESATAGPVGTATKRLLSLDVFRGATIATMILVDDPGGADTYWPLRHAEWNGWTPTDLVFPFFLFIVGVAMAFSFNSRLQRGESRQQLFGHVLWRGLALFALGMFLNGFPNHYHLATWRVYGVLQRIALCYVMTAILALWSDYRGWLVAATVCLAGYWILLRYMPVAGFGLPGRAVPLLDPDQNLTAWLDRKLLFGHLYEGTRDPEGLLSSVPAVATCLSGLLTGHWLGSRYSAGKKVRAMLSVGIACVLLGEISNVWLPINKKLWTSSYVLLTTGFALVSLAFCYWLFDMKRRKGPISKFFVIYGMNAIAAYVLAELLAIGLSVIPAGQGMSLQDYIYQLVFMPLASPPNASLLFATTFTFVCWLPMWLLYRNRVFIKI